MASAICAQIQVYNNIIDLYEQAHLKATITISFLDFANFFREHNLGFVGQ